MTQYDDPSRDSFSGEESPRITVEMDAVQSRNEIPQWQKVIGWASLAGAMMLTVGAVILLLLPQPVVDTDTPPQETAVVDAALGATESVSTESTIDEPTATTQADEPANGTQSQERQPIPTVNAERIASLLQTPVSQVGESAEGGGLTYDPFTIIPPRPRTEFTNYTVVRGDTIDGISTRFNIEKESIAWCNDPRIIFAIRPGDVLRIPPVDGACHQVLGTRNQTIAEIAAEYNISDPYRVIDSPYNPQLYGRSPDDVLPGGLSLFLPGGEGQIIAWNPPVERETDASGNVVRVSFANGLPGSCGATSPGAGVAWGNPLPNGTWMRGFFAGHSGIDLAAPVGTPIFAANTGPVLFSGFSEWGYGEAVVLSHGPFSTLYAHMSSRGVSCGQSVNVGGIVGYVGSTGNSTGPHLHFEVRYDNEPFDPTTVAGVGW